jgi:phosphate transport system permease protein
MLVTLALAFPIGVLSAVYLEEYAPRNRWTDMIEVSINNLAAVPLDHLRPARPGHLPQRHALAALRADRRRPDAGADDHAGDRHRLAQRDQVGAALDPRRRARRRRSRVQVVFHHVLPLALPGILTGTIIGMARALGETAPLLMIGMRAFVASPPGGFTDPASVLPVQIFLWSDEVERGFVEKTSAAIIVLLAFLLAMNAIAIYLRNKFERRW